MSIDQMSTNSAVRQSVAICVLLTLAVWSWSMQAQETTVKAETMVEWLDAPDKPIVLDVRTREEFNKGHISGAVLIPHIHIGSRSSELNQLGDRPIVVYCESGPRAKFAKWVLERQGFNRITLLAGHMRNWRKAKLPLEKPTKRK